MFLALMHWTLWQEQDYPESALSWRWITVLHRVLLWQGILLLFLVHKPVQLRRIQLKLALHLVKPRRSLQILLKWVWLSVLQEVLLWRVTLLLFLVHKPVQLRRIQLKLALHLVKPRRSLQILLKWVWLSVLQEVLLWRVTLLLLHLVKPLKSRQILPRL